MDDRPRARLAVTGPLVSAQGRTYGALSLHPDGAWEIGSLEPHVTIRLKQLFPAVPKQARPPFRLPATHVIAHDLLWFADRYPLALSIKDREKLEEDARAYTAKQAEMERILLPEWRPSEIAGLQPGQALRSYQSQAIELAIQSCGLLLGDECGLGKTFTGAGLCLMPGALPAAVVCQPHIQKQWCRVLTEFTTLRAHQVRSRKHYELPAADVYVFRYSQLIGWIDLFKEIDWGAVVFDEPQELRTGRSSQKGAAANVLSKEGRFRLGLTATPIYNYGVEIFNILEFMRPDVLGEFEDFNREWCGGRNKLTDPKALGSYLRDQHAFLRRTKADVGKELAPVNRIVDIVAWDEDHVRSIEETARQLAIRAVTGSFIERGSAARELDMLARQATGVAKAAAVADVVRIIVESGEPVVLFGWHRAVYDIWLERLADLDPRMYTGTESPTAKAQAAADFAAGRSNLLIMSLRSAAGLDGLQYRCSTCVFGELDWSPGVHHQCIERLDRDGQDKPVTALFLVAEDGSDPPIMGVLGLKASEAASVVDPTLDLQAVHSDRDRIRLLVERYLNTKVDPSQLVVEVRAGAAGEDRVTDE